jgi:hypothetical protein
VGQDQRRPLLDGELQEEPLELVTVDELAEPVLAGRLIDRQHRDLDGSPPALPDLVLAGIDEEAMEPSIELVAVAKTAKIAPGPDEGVLDGILRGIPIAQDSPRDRVQAVVCGAREGIECLVVAPLCALDELGRHRCPSVRRGDLPRCRV